MKPPTQNGHGNSHGFSLIELLVTIAVAAILLAVVAPSFRDFLHSNRISTQTNDIVSAFNLARSESIKRGSNVRVGTYVGTDWADGWVVWVDSDNDNARSAAETIRVWEGTQIIGTIVSSGATTEFQYLASGAIDVADNFRICDTLVNNNGRQILVAATGRLSTSKIDCSV